jgi:hypothetical protein
LRPLKDTLNGMRSFFVKDGVNVKKIIFSCLVFLLLPSVASAYSSDLNVEFEVLKKKSIFSELRADDFVTRAEFAVVMTKLMDYPVDAPDSGFKDATRHWGREYINAMKSQGLMHGKTETLFSPDDNITNWQLDAILKRAGLSSLHLGIAPNQKNAKRGDIIKYAYAIYQSRKIATDVIRVVKADVKSKDTIEVSFSDEYKEIFFVPPLAAGKPTWVEVAYKNQTFPVSVTWTGPTGYKIKTFKTRLNVNAGVIEKDKITYFIYNEQDQIIPLPLGMKVKFSSSYEQLSPDGWFDNAKNALPVGTSVAYSISLIDEKNDTLYVYDGAAIVYDAPQGEKPTIARLVHSASNQFWNVGYVSMQNNQVIEPFIKIIVSKANDVNGNAIDVFTGKDDYKDENIGERSYVSTDERIAKVDQDGTIHPVSPGNVRIFITSGDFELYYGVWVYPDQKPANLVYSTINASASQTEFRFRVKDQFGQYMRMSSEFSRFKIKTKSDLSHVVDLSSIQIEVKNEQVLVSGVKFATGIEDLEIFYDGSYLGEIHTNVR